MLVFHLSDIKFLTVALSENSLLLFLFVCIRLWHRCSTSYQKGFPDFYIERAAKWLDPKRYSEALKFIELVMRVRDLGAPGSASKLLRWMLSLQLWENPSDVWTTYRNDGKLQINWVFLPVMYLNISFRCGKQYRNVVV